MIKYKLICKKCKTSFDSWFSSSKEYEKLKTLRHLSCQSCNSIEVAEYMRGEKIDININLNIGNKNFTAYTMDFTKKYIEINADYRN